MAVKIRNSRLCIAVNIFTFAFSYHQRCYSGTTTEERRNSTRTRLLYMVQGTRAHNGVPFPHCSLQNIGTYPYTT